MLNNIIGQDKLKERIKTYIKLFRKTGKALPHSLIYGRAGFGKTTLARAIASDLNVDCVEAYGNSLRSNEDIYELFLSSNKKLANGSIIFIDEIHAMGKEAMECLYPIMTEGKIRINTDVVDLPVLTIIGGTTNPGLLLKPLFDRFVEKFTLTQYTVQELMQIGKNYIPDLEVSPVVLKAIAEISSGTPRIMKSFMLSLQAWCIANEYNKVEFGHFVKFLVWLDIDKYGMTINDRQYIRTIFMNGNAPLGIQKLCKLSYITQDDVEQVIEPKLIERGFVTFTAKGRSLSNAGLIYARENIR